MRHTLLTLLLVLLGATPAAASWTTGGTGSGTALTADMPTGATPTVAVATRSVTVTWAQNAFAGGTIGNRGGSYTITRYAEGSSTPITPGAGCAGPHPGSTNPQTCTETNVPYGRWIYRVTPVLNTFTGTQGPASLVADVQLPPPVLQSVTAQNPAAGNQNGPIFVDWDSSVGATGYNVYRRTTGAYNFSTPLNGATPVTATSFSDITAANRVTYSYVVRAVIASPSTTSPSSNELSARVITRPSAPTSATAASGTGGAINVSWGVGASAEGYNVYRRTSSGSFNFSQPLNGASPLTARTFADLTAAPGTGYVYGIRSVITGAGAVRLESTSTRSTSGSVSCTSTFNAAVLADSPIDNFRLGDTSAAVAANTTRPGTGSTGVG